MLGLAVARPPCVRSRDMNEAYTWTGSTSGGVEMVWNPTQLTKYAWDSSIPTATTDTMELYEYRIIYVPSDEALAPQVLATGEVFAKSPENARTAAMMEGGSTATGYVPSEITVLVRRFLGE